MKGRYVSPNALCQAADKADMLVWGELQLDAHSKCVSVVYRFACGSWFYSLPVMTVYLLKKATDLCG